jgi:hypothetical protein
MVSIRKRKYNEVMTHSAWIEDNWKFLNKWTRAWADEHWVDLASNLTLYLDKEWKKFSKIPTDDEKIRFVQSWMRNQTRWSKTQYSKDVRINSFDEEWDFTNVDPQSTSEILIRAEDCREDIKDWIVDIEDKFSERDCTRLIKIRNIYLRLKTHEKVLYTLYFTEMKSLREIASQLDLPLSAIHTMMLELKIKIKNGVDN